jgi:hypothetical protein
MAYILLRNIDDRPITQLPDDKKMAVSSVPEAQARYFRRVCRRLLERIVHMHKKIKSKKKKMTKRLKTQLETAKTGRPNQDRREDFERLLNDAARPYGT